MNILRTIARLALFGQLCCTPQFVWSMHSGAVAQPVHPGLIVLAEYRFDPLVQRLMAERSLKALPLKDGQLFYLYPVGQDPRLEEMQIPYLEVLLDKKSSAETAAGEPSDE